MYLSSLWDGGIAKKLIPAIRRTWCFYLTGAVFVIGLKYLNSRAGSRELEWLLAPTAHWAGLLGGISFEKAPGAGYVSHTFRFLIAPSCAGVQFLGIAAATLLFSFLHRMPTRKKCCAWTALCLAAAYPYTVLANGLRIVAAVYLPLYLDRAGVLSSYGGLTPERLHTIIGVAVYFTALLILYRIGDHASRRAAGMDRAGKGRAAIDCTDLGWAAITHSGSPVRADAGKAWTDLARKCAPPLFWYCIIVLGLPFLNRAYSKGNAGFAEYAAIISAVCLAVILFYYIAYLLLRRRALRHKGPMQAGRDSRSYSAVLKK